MNWEEIRQEYEITSITMKALAEKHGVKLGTLKSRKSREKWLKEDATATHKDATSKTDATQPGGIPDIESLADDELTEKQRMFCIHYVKTFNATQSAINAGYSPNGAHVRGNELLRNSKVKAYIKELKTSITDTLFIEAMDVLRKYAEIAFADITDYLTFGKKEVEVMGAFGPIKDDDGNPLMKEVNYIEFNESGLVDGSLISEAKQGKDGVSIKLADKMKALDKLWEYFEILPESTKEKLQQEKLKADIARSKAETEKIASNDDDKPIEIRISRAGERNGD